VSVVIDVRCKELVKLNIELDGRSYNEVVNDVLSSTKVHIICVFTFSVFKTFNSILLHVGF